MPPNNNKEFKIKHINTEDLVQVLVCEGRHEGEENL